MINVKDFRFSSMSSKEGLQNIDSSFLDGLFEQLTVKSYSRSLNHIDFNFVALPPKAARREDRIIVRRTDKSLEIFINVDYLELVNSGSEYARELIMQAYLDGIEKFLIPRKDFDGKRFYDDVKRLFEPFLQSQTA